MTPKMDPLTELSFRPLNVDLPNTLLYTPDSSASAASDSELKLMILTTWLGGATAKRIAVYCRAYQKLFPTTPILLIRTVLSDITTKSFSTVQKQLAPAADYIRSLYESSESSQLCGDNRPGSTLLHCFSHGGCNTALQLSRLLRSTEMDANPSIESSIPLRGIILDSCPGSSSFTKSYASATYSLPQHWATNFVGRICLLPTIATISTLQWLGVWSSVEDLRRELNDLSTFGRAPRLYLHSAGDAVVAPEDVASHANELAAKGVDVRREQWAIAEHCALPMEDAKRYWETIEAFVAGEGKAREVKL